MQIFKEQECIPVGCILPAAVAIRGVSTRHPQSRHAPQSRPHLGADPPAADPPARHAGIPPAMHAGIAPPCKACWDTTCNACWDSTPPVNRMTSRCKNITLPQTSFAGSNKNAFQHDAYHQLVAHIAQYMKMGIRTVTAIIM